MYTNTYVVIVVHILVNLGMYIFKSMTFGRPEIYTLSRYTNLIFVDALFFLKQGAIEVNDRMLKYIFRYMWDFSSSLYKS